MRKFFRNLFSGYILVLLILLIELIIIILSDTLLDSIAEEFYDSEIGTETIRNIVTLVYILLRIAIVIISIIIFFKIINRDEAPDFKIPWILVMMILPVFGCTVFLIFGNHGLRKRDKKIIELSNEAYKKAFDRSLVKDYRVELGDAYGAFRYIANTTGMGAYNHNRVSYFKTGEECFPQIIEDMKKAEKFIFIEFFIITDGKLWTEFQEVLIERAQAGVDVKIVYDDMGSSGTISHKTPKILAKYGIHCVKFHPFRPILSGVYNNRDHRKIVIIDHKYGYTGGMNLADEYANLITRFGYWKDTMVRIEGSAINNLIATFLQNYNLASRTIEDFSKYLTNQYEIFEDKGFVAPFGDGPGGIDNALVGEQNYINMLNFAQKEVFISTPYLIPTYNLVDAIRNASLRGVKVHLIVPAIPDKKLVYKVTMSHFRYLLDAGVKIYKYSPGFNHMKSCLADDKLAFVGTINFDYRSLVHHFECGALLYDLPCIKDIKEDFLEMINQSEEVPEDFKLSRRTRRLCSIVKLIQPLL